MQMHADADADMQTDAAADQRDERSESAVRAERIDYGDGTARKAGSGASTMSETEFRRC
jgi:hypothetical protein